MSIFSNYSNGTVYPLETLQAILQETLGKNKLYLCTFIPEFQYKFVYDTIIMSLLIDYKN